MASDRTGLKTVLLFMPSCKHFTTPSVEVMVQPEGRVLSGNATGLYWFFIGNCNPIDLVVGELPAHAFPSNLFCISSSGTPSSETVTGVTNINVALVPWG